MKTWLWFFQTKFMAPGGFCRRRKMVYVIVVLRRSIFIIYCILAESFPSRLTRNISLDGLGSLIMFGLASTIWWVFCRVCRIVNIFNWHRLTTLCGYFQFGILTLLIDCDCPICSLLINILIDFWISFLVIKMTLVLRIRN